MRLRLLSLLPVAAVLMWLALSARVQSQGAAVSCAI
jgi:hypothetical protein